MFFGNHVCDKTRLIDMYVYMKFTVNYMKYICRLSVVCKNAFVCVYDVFAVSRSKAPSESL